jgi:WD40 repeat protein
MANANGPTGARLGCLLSAGGWLLATLVALGVAAVVAIGRRADLDVETDGRIFAQAAVFDLHSCVWSLAFSPVGDTLAATTLSSELWLMDDARAVRTLVRKTRMKVVRSLAFSPDGLFLAIGGPGRVVRLVDTSSASDLWALEPDGDDNASVIAISLDGRYLAAGGYGGTVTIWDLGPGRE